MYIYVCIYIYICICIYICIYIHIYTWFIYILYDIYIYGKFMALPGHDLQMVDFQEFSGAMSCNVHGRTLQTLRLQRCLSWSWSIGHSESTCWGRFRLVAIWTFLEVSSKFRARDDSNPFDLIWSVHKPPQCPPVDDAWHGLVDALTSSHFCWWKHLAIQMGGWGEDPDLFLASQLILCLLAILLFLISFDIFGHFTTFHDVSWCFYLYRYSWNPFICDSSYDHTGTCWAIAIADFWPSLSSILGSK